MAKSGQLTGQSKNGSAGGVNAFAWALAAVSLGFGLLVLGPRLSQLLVALVHPGLGVDLANSDFINYWMAGQLVLGGQTALLFDPPAYNAHLQSLFGAGYPPHAWSYPPHAVLLFLPLGMLPFKLAAGVFLGLTGALHVWAVHSFMHCHAKGAPVALVLAAHVAFVLVNLVSLQNGFLTAGLLLGAFALADRRPVLAGLLLALLSFKPQLGILVPFALLFARQWRVILSASGFSIGLVLLSVLAFGGESWRAYLTVSVPFQQEVMTQWTGGMLLMMPTVLSALRMLGFDPQIASSAQMLFALVMLPIALLVLWRARSPLQALFALALGTFLVLPYSFNYDMGALVSASALLLALPHRRAMSEKLLLAALCMAPVLVILTGLAAVPLTPLLLLAGLASAWQRKEPGLAKA